LSGEKKRRAERKQPPAISLSLLALALLVVAVFAGGVNLHDAVACVANYKPRRTST